jgi:methylated-DNA-[protein]-cysteine S-methyltransferase
MNYYYLTMPSPLGHLKLIANERGMVAILWENDDPKRVKIPEQKMNQNYPILIKARKQLQAYFDGKCDLFSLSFDLHGSDFQKQVWHALLTIPYGKTVSYLDIAKKIGRPSASRAVGMATGRNPLSIVIPCHRVIGSNGKLTGFAGGLDAKAFLLQLEKNLLLLEKF